MKTIISKIIKPLLVVGFILLFSCQKDKEILGTLPIAKVNVINAVIGSDHFNVNISANQRDSVKNILYYGGGKLSIVPTNKSTFLTVTPINNVGSLWYNKVANLKEGKMYTLYLSGTPTSVDSLFREETSFKGFVRQDINTQFQSADSVVYIKFANLCPNGPDVNINILGKNTNEASGLGYQESTDFKAISATESYITFEVRNAQNGNLISTFALNNLNTPGFSDRFKSIAFVIVGKYVPSGGIPVPWQEAYSIVKIAYY